MCVMSSLLSNDSPTSASIVDVPASKEAAAPAAHEPSANARMGTSKPVPIPAAVRRYRPLLLIAFQLAFIMSTHTLINDFFPPSIDATESMRQELRQQLVENGARLYGVSSCASTQKQLADLGTTEHYTQGLDYVDCEADAAFCRLMNVTSYPTWQINGQLYPGYYSLEKLLVRLSGDDDDHDDHDHDHDDLDVVTAIWCMLLITSWFLFFAWLSFPGAGACLLSPEEMKARHEAEMASRLGEARVNNLLKI